MSTTLVRALRRAGCAIGFLAAAACGVLADPVAEKDPWPGLASDIFGGRPLLDGTGVLAIEMPGRAEDAAIVPVTVRATLAPGYVGFYLVEIEIPKVVNYGPSELYLEADGHQSNPVRIYVEP